MQEFEYQQYQTVTSSIVKKFGSIFELPIVDVAREISYYYTEGNVLDLGAGADTPWKSFFSFIKNGRYYSLDNTPRAEVDFFSLQEVPQDLKFGLIIANQLFEHLGIEEGIEMFHAATQHLEVGGKIIITIPNILHPNRWMSDVTHKTFWNFHSAPLLCHYAGIETVKLARYSKRRPQGIIEKLVAYYVGRIYRMDWADSILMVGAKNE